MNKNYLKTSFLAFAFSLLTFIGLLIFYKFATNSYTTALPNILKNFNHIDYAFLFLILFFFISLVSFLVGASDLATYFLEQKRIQNYLLKSVIFIFMFITLPFYIIFHGYFTTLRLLLSLKILTTFKLKIFLLQIVFSIFVIFILVPIWIGVYFTLSAITTRIILQTLGYAPVTEYVAGTGSMYPTFPKGDKIKPIDQLYDTVATPSFISYPSGIILFNKRYLGRDLKRGDIVSFSNQKTAEITKKEYGIAVGFIKRIIALPGDNIELRAGIVYLNGKPLKEPYTAKPQSSFGENYLSDCHIIKVPKNQVFVMGDNRKGSEDSRDIGFINENDIDHVLPIENQKGLWDKNWRDTSKDLDPSSKIKLSANDYLTLLNQKRSEANAKPLSYETKLSESANIRGDAIIKFDDFSFSATRSGVTMQKAMSQAGYSNIIYGETITQGYYEASELLENQFAFPDTKKFLLNKDYQDIGVAQVDGNINNCPTQVIVQQFAGYIPPNYPDNIIKSWENALNALNKISKSWQDLKTIPDAYNKDKADIDRINVIISQRLSMISGILDKMHANLWLTNAQNEYMKTTDKALSQEESDLSQKINNLLTQH